jgi:hypothetical protein
VKRYLAAVRRASRVVDVPGAPRSLRLDDAAPVGQGVRLRWSFVDPEVLPHERPPHGRRIRGDLEVRVAQGVPEEVARTWWAEAQLAAARRYKLQVDADWLPGEPFVRRVWTTEEAWQALLAHLGSYGAVVRVEGREIRVRDGPGETVYRIDPDEWAQYLTDPEIAEEPGDTDIVPAANPLVDGLPLWAVDELDEAAGAWGPVIGLVDGEIVGLRARDH